MRLILRCRHHTVFGGAGQYCTVPESSTVLTWIREIRLETPKFPILTGTGEKYQQNNELLKGEIQKPDFSYSSYPNMEMKTWH